MRQKLIDLKTQRTALLEGAEALLKELDYPEELIMNRDPAAYRAFINRRRDRR